jgi:hypothetical protein
MVQPCSGPASDGSWHGAPKDKEHTISSLNSGIAAIGINIGKNSFHVVGQDKRGTIVLRRLRKAPRSEPGRLSPFGPLSG